MWTPIFQVSATQRLVSGNELQTALMQHNAHLLGREQKQNKALAN